MSNQSLSKSQGIIQSSYPSSPQAAGMIIAFAGSSAPSGWAICDGSELPIASYGQLYGRIGTTWNNARNQSTGSNWANPTAGNFRLPDLRGTFLRATGTSNGYRATTLGATQDDATAKNGLSLVDSGHNHQLGYNPGSVWQAGGSGADFGRGTSNYSAADLTSTSTTGITISAGDTETSPVNVGVNYLIKLYDDAGAIVMSGSPFVGSEFQPAPITITGNNTLDYSKFYTCDSATPTTQTLPAATGSNKVITIENTNTGLLTVDGNASETINGSLNQVIGQYQSLKVRDYAVGKWIVMH